MDKKNRIHYVDAAKAIAIILVIIGHCYWISVIPRLGYLIYSFHMPLFFIVSVFFLKNLTVKNAIEKYAKALFNDRVTHSPCGHCQMFGSRRSLV